MLAGTVLELLALCLLFFASAGDRHGWTHTCACTRTHTHIHVDKVRVCVQCYRRQWDYPSFCTSDIRGA